MLIRPSFRISKFLSLFTLAILTITGIAACDQASTQNSTQPIKIGFSAPLTGDFSVDGKALQQGYQLWADAVNKNGGLLGRKVQLDSQNDNSNPQTATAAYQKMVNVNHDDLLFGSFTDGLTISGAEVAQRSGYAFIEGAGNAPDTFALRQKTLKNLFSVSLSTVDYLTSFTYYILSLPVNQRPKTVAYMLADDAFTHPQIDPAKDRLDHHGVTSVLYKTYPDETTDFTSLAQQVVQSNADLVILGSLGPADSVAFIKAFKQQNYKPEAVIATSGPDQGKQFTDPLGGPNAAEGIFVPNGGWFPGITTYQNAEFTKAYVAKYGGTAADISSDTVQAYSVGQVLEQAVKKTNSIDNAKLIQELNTDSFNTLQGRVQFDAQGANKIASAFLFQWQKGNLIPVYPANQAQANPEIFPRH